MRIEWANETERLRFAKLINRHLAGLASCLSHENCPAPIVNKAKSEMVFWIALAKECDPDFDADKIAAQAREVREHLTIDASGLFTIVAFSPEEFHQCLSH